MERLRNSCTNIRNLAIIDLLASSGIRISELVNLNRDDINFENKSCIVFGKGKKMREVYFDGKAKLHMEEYLNNRIDNNEALFVSNNKPYDRLQSRGIELMLQKLGKELGEEKVHPHKFRRTLATKAIDKGMPIEQVQKLLGHQKIDIEKYLDDIVLVVVGGESDINARPFNYDWALSIREQCIRKNVNFEFRQCGTYTIKDGKQYKIQTKDLCKQAKLANINYKKK